MTRSNLLWVLSSYAKLKSLVLKTKWNLNYV